MPAGDCDMAEYCDGINTLCPNNTFNDSSTLCRAKNGSCDMDDYCTGKNASCTPDFSEPNGTVCRQSKGDCYPEEMYDYILIDLLLLLIWFVY
jgi:hypothetical protein